MKDPKEKPIGHSPFEPLLPQPKDSIFDVMHHTEIERPTVIDYCGVNVTTTDVVGHK